MRRTDRRKKRPSQLRKKLVSTALEAYEMPDFSLPSIQGRGNREFCIEGCKGILEYEQGRIRLNCGKLIIGFEGDEIEITAYSEIQTVISGTVTSIDFQGSTED